MCTHNICLWEVKKNIMWASTWQNQQNGMCIQRRLRSAWASTQSDQPCRCPHEESFDPNSYPLSAQLIRLGGCPHWSESPLGANATLLVLSKVAHVYYLDIPSYLELCLTLVLLNPDIPCHANSVDPDQLASEEANWSGSTLFVIKCVNLYQQPWSSNLIGWNLEMGVAS